MIINNTKREISSGVYIFISILTLSLNALLFIPLLIKGIITKQKSTPLFTAIFFSLISYYFIPPEEFDLYRHYESFEYFLLNSEPLHKLKDLYLLSLFNISEYLNIKKEFLYAISVIIYYYIITSVFISLLKTNNINDKKLILILSFLYLFSNTLVEISGLRFTTGLAFSILFLHKYFIVKNKKISIYTYMLLAILSHFSLIIIPITILIYKLFYKLFFDKKFSIFLLFFTLLLGLFFINDLISILIINIEDITGLYIGAEAYTNGAWGVNRLDIQKYNSTGFFVEKSKLYITILISLIISILLIFSKENYLNSLSKYLILLTSISFLLTNFDTIYFRYQSLLTIITLMIITTNKINYKKLNSGSIILILLYIKTLHQFSLGFISTYLNYLSGISYIDVINNSNIISFFIYIFNF
ncbi:hypothetical protein [Proteus vulgaris]|uniref:hypothetical protein n=1 Tax=Proteus vulgaris TaxID=585 RepID=UPI002361CA14|nr:hypothetical protein [Proteus vulgaris]